LIVERRKKRMSKELFDLIMDEIKKELTAGKFNYKEIIEKVVNNELDPHTAAEKLVKMMLD